MKPLQEARRVMPASLKQEAHTTTSDQHAASCCVVRTLGLLSKHYRPMSKSRLSCRHLNTPTIRGGSQIPASQMTTCVHVQMQLRSRQPANRQFAPTLDRRNARSGSPFWDQKAAWSEGGLLLSSQHEIPVYVRQQAIGRGICVVVAWTGQSGGLPYEPCILKSRA